MDCSIVTEPYSLLRGGALSFCQSRVIGRACTLSKRRLLHKCLLVQVRERFGVPMTEEAGRQWLRWKRSSDTVLPEDLFSYFVP